jgi:hypothetical protein
MYLGLLVHGDNHFVVRGPLPSPGAVERLLRAWTMIQIGGGDLRQVEKWRISTEEFRENLEWAVVALSPRAHSEAVRILLEELRSRGVKIYDWPRETWPGDDGAFARGSDVPLAG